MAIRQDDTEYLLAEGQAALMIAESLMLLLVESGIVEKAKLIEAIETVIATKRSMMLDGSAPEVAAVAVGVLSSIANSLTAIDNAPEPPPASTPPAPRRRA